MSTIEDGGPAYPVPDPFLLQPGHEDVMKRLASGMSLRDYFAGQALVGLILNAKRNPITDEEFVWLGSTSLRVADEILRARKAGAE
jgi:hypothetical protein